MQQRGVCDIKFALATVLVVQVTAIVGQECLKIMARFKGGLLGEGHSWVAIDKPKGHGQHELENGGRDQLIPASIDAHDIDLARQLSSLEAEITQLVQGFIPNLIRDEPLMAQGLDSLAALELRQKISEKTGMDIMTLVEDPERATISAIVREVAALHNSNQKHNPSIHSSQRHDSPAAVWISPAPVSIKMRVFCLPYAGGVSENIFAR
jgi:aryl carrier-like protein